MNEDWKSFFDDQLARGDREEAEAIKDVEQEYKIAELRRANEKLKARLERQKEQQAKSEETTTVREALSLKDQLDSLLKSITRYSIELEKRREEILEEERKINRRVNELLIAKDVLCAKVDQMQGREQLPIPAEEWRVFNPTSEFNLEKTYWIRMRRDDGNVYVCRGRFVVAWHDDNDERPIPINDLNIIDIAEAKK